MKMVKDFLADLMAIRTDGSVSGAKQCIDYICHVLQQNDVLFECLQHAENEKKSIVAVVNAQKLQDISGGLVLSGHIDTVSANCEEWKTPPFELTEVGDRLCGRGSVDMKYFAAVLLAELSVFKKAPFPIFLVFTSDEETDVCGARTVVSFFKERRIFPQYALIGEPTNFKICVENKGYVGYRTIIKGIAAHSSRPDLGVNATYVAAKLISEIERLNAFYMPLGTTLNVGVVNGGKERNSIADEVCVDWEIRYVAEEHKKSILAKWELLQRELATVYKGADIQLFAQETLPTFVKKSDSQLAKVIAGLLKTEELSLQYATEAGFFQQAGIDTIICGAGDENLAHTSVEHILCSDVERYSLFLRQLLQQLAKIALSQRIHQ